MACNEKTLLLISTYADGETTREETARAIAHLETCRDCQKMVSEWQQQRQVLDWAYTFELPEQVTLNVEKTSMTTHAKKASGINWRWSFHPRLTTMSFPKTGKLVKTVALAAAVLIAFFLLRMTTTAPMLSGKLQTGNTPQIARMPGNIQLEVGPHSKITRMGDSSIRLDEGWVSANVRHGTRFKIVSPRLQVMDLGTKFEVGTGEKTDYVLVDEGSVEVTRGNKKNDLKAGQVFMAQDKGDPVIASMLDPGFGEDNSRALEQKKDETFIPCRAMDLDFDEGIQRLASTFPDTRIGPRTSGSGSSSKGATEYRFGYQPVAGLRAGLRTHFYDIAQAMAGGATGSDEWEMPVAVVQTSSILLDPQLPADVYMLQLVCKNKTLVWRLIGSTGNRADYPFDVKETADEWDSKILATAGQVVYSASSGTKIKHGLVIAGWPGKLKPVMIFELGSDPSDEATLWAQVNSRLPRMNDFDPMQGAFKRLYFDRERRHLFIIIWNRDAAKQLCRLSDSAKLGLGGSVILGAIDTTMPMEEPAVNAGTYLLRFVLPMHQSDPHLELATPDGRVVAGSGMLRRKGSVSELKSIVSGYGEMFTLPGYGTIGLNVDVMPSDGEAFPFKLSVIGKPDDKSTAPVSDHHGGTSWKTPTRTWTEGWIRIKKP